MFSPISSVPGLLLLAALLAAPSSLRAQDESKVGTPITSLPYTVTAPGVYTLTQDFLQLNLAAGAAIQINASDVVLDLNGHTLSNLGASAGTAAYGVLAQDQSNVTVRNGTLQGFLGGVALASASATSPTALSFGHLIENLNVNQCTLEGIDLLAADSIVRSCQVTATGGSTILGDVTGAYGIELSGAGLRCLDCDVSGVTAGGFNGFAYAIHTDGASDVFAVDNRVSATQYGIYFDVSATGQYRHNLATGILQQAYVGGTDAGHNMVDSNGNGLDDDWELRYFGSLGVDPDALAPNGSGLTNLQEYQAGLNPNDIYNGQTPALAIVSGNAQTGPPSGFVPAPLVVSVVDGSGIPVINAPVAFTVTQGGGQVQKSSNSSPAASVTILTDGNGQAKAFFQLPNSPASTSQITASTGNGSRVAQATFVESSDNGSGSFGSPFNPSNVVATMNSDGSGDVSWTNNADPTDPTPTNVRYKDVHGNWQILVTVPAGVSNYHIPAP